MISVNKSILPIPSIFNKEILKTKLAEIISNENGSNIKTIYNEESVRVALRNIYGGKCAYCESEINTASFVERVDHYRPKDKIKNIDKQNVTYIDENGNTVLHKGYYWLGYEWTNLLPTCEGCNLPKSNIFPLEDEQYRITRFETINGELNREACRLDSIFLRNEHPLLLNPEIDKPEDHLFFLPSGKIKFLTQRGESTIKICKLDRDELIAERKSISDKIISKIEKYIDRFLSKNDEKELQISFRNLFEEIESKAIDAKTPFARFSWFIFYKFNLFILERLPTKQRKMVERAFYLYKLGKL